MMWHDPVDPVERRRRALALLGREWGRWNGPTWALREYRLAEREAQRERDGARAELLSLLVAVHQHRAERRRLWAGEIERRGRRAFVAENWRRNVWLRRDRRRGPRLPHLTGGDVEGFVVYGETVSGPLAVFRWKATAPDADPARSIAGWRARPWTDIHEPLIVRLPREHLRAVVREAERRHVERLAFDLVTERIVLVPPDGERIIPLRHDGELPHSCHEWPCCPPWRWPRWLEWPRWCLPEHVL